MTQTSRPDDPTGHVTGPAPRAGLARRRGRQHRRRRAERCDVGAPGHPLAPSAQGPAEPLLQGHQVAGRHRRGRERRPALHPLPRQGRHRLRHPADQRGRQPRAAADDRRGDARRHDHPGGDPQRVPGAVGDDRPGRPLPDPAAGVPALPATQPRLPRQLHLGPGDLPADLRRRRHLRDARVRVRRPGHRRADPGRDGRPAAVPRRQARPGGAGLRAVPGVADQLVPQVVGQELPRHPREGRAGDRALRRVDERDPRGPGLPPRASQPGDLRRRQRAVPRRQPGRLPPGRLVHARHPPDRQHHHRAGAHLRRLPGVPRRGHGRRAGRVPALPAAVLRADAGDLAVLQHLPVRLGRPREALGRARGGARRPRAEGPGAAARS